MAYLPNPFTHAGRETTHRCFRYALRVERRLGDHSTYWEWRRECIGAFTLSYHGRITDVPQKMSHERCIMSWRKIMLVLVSIQRKIKHNFTINLVYSSFRIVAKGYLYYQNLNVNCEHVHSICDHTKSLKIISRHVVHNITILIRHIHHVHSVPFNR